MALNFDKFANDGKAFVNDLARGLGYPENTNKASRVLKAVLHALRDRIVWEESLQLLAQLPMFLKAVYVEGWTSSRKQSKSRSLEAFIDEVVQADGRAAIKDFATDADAEHAIRTVFEALRKYVSEGEIADIRAELPREVEELLR